ncbi:MAG: NUDIX hydrolase, partial [Actinobacteria bacterium]|nr:NUDIX hydrolase [Actinomycetota bacterium]
MTIYLVRHAKAGSRKNWDDDDTQRPLVESGREQARLLVQKFENV